MNRLLVVTSVYAVLNATGLFTLRHAMDGTGGDSVGSVLLKPVTLVGVGLYGASFVLFVLTLRHYPLTVVFPIFVGAGYAAAAIGGWAVLREGVSFLGFLGVLLVGIGVVLVQLGR